MPKKELFQKLTSYKEQLEAILEEKSFPSDAENLLLNMLYKIENSYNDYEMVKRVVEDKRNFIERLLKIIDECQNIELLSTNSSTMNKLKKKKTICEIDEESKKIKTFPDEKAMLEALYRLESDTKIYLDENYSSIRNSLPYILSEGKRESKTEVIRDFNAWSWNTDLKEIRNFECNLIYNNLLLLLGQEFINEWTMLSENKNAPKILIDELNECFKTEKEIDEFVNLIFKISIIIYCKKDKKEKQRLDEELKFNIEEFQRLSNTGTLIEEITKSKQKSNREIKKIDKILNDKELMQKEIEKSIDNEGVFITEKEIENNLKRKRRKLEKGIKELNKFLDAKFYGNYKQKIENNIKLLKAIKEQTKKEEYIITIQKLFIKGLENKILLTNNKKDLINILYIIRYYNFIPFSEDKYIKDVVELKSDLSELEDLIISKLDENKMINKFSDVAKFDKKIIKKTLKLRIIDIEKIYIEFQKGEKIRIIFYDDDSIEKAFEVKGNDLKISKFNKKMKIFLK